LELVKVDKDPWSFDGVLLEFIFIFLVVIVDGLTFFVVIVVQVPNAVAKGALLALVDAQASEIEAAEAFLGRGVVLFHKILFFD
jgi:hypothetical protein